MKKSSIIWVGFIIVAIIAIVKTASFMTGLGFSFSILIGGFALICIFGAIYLGYEAYQNLKQKDIGGVIGNIVLLAVFAFLGIKILGWLIGVLM